MVRLREMTIAALLMPTVLLPAGCSEEHVSGPGSDHPQALITDEAVVIDEEPGLSLYDIDEDRIVLRHTGGKEIAPDEIIVGSARGGFIRRAVSVESDGSFLDIETRPARLTSIVVKGGADKSFNIGFGSMAEGEETAAYASSEPAAVGDTLAAMPTSGINLSGIVLYSDPEAPGVPVVRIENGYAAISPVVDVGLTIRGRSVTRLELAIDGEFNIDLDIHAFLPEPVSHAGEIRVATIRTSGKMMIGIVPIPLLVTMDIILDYSIDGYVIDNCDAGYTGSHDISSTMSYGGGWTLGNPSSEPRFDTAAFECGLFSDCRIRVAARTVTRISFYSADTATFVLEPWIDISTVTEQEPVWQWQLDGGLSITRSFIPGVLDFSIPKMEAQTLTESVVLDSGPFEESGFIFVTDWDGSESQRGLFDQPRGIAVGPDGKVYVTDQNNHRVVVFDRLGEFIDEWGIYGSSEGSLLFPTGIAVAPDGAVFVADSGNHRVQKFTSDGSFLGAWGEMGTGDGQFVQIEGLAAGPDSLIAVCDSGTNTFSIFTSDGRFIDKNDTNSAMGTAFDLDSNIYVAGCYFDGISVFNRSGQLLTETGTDSECPIDLDIDPGGNIYLLDYSLCQLIVLDPGGVEIARFGSSGGGAGQFGQPGGVAVSDDGLVYIADTFNDRIQVFARR